MPNYACKLVNSTGTLSERSIAAKSRGELYKIIDSNGERLISAKKGGFNLSNISWLLILLSHRHSLFLNQFLIYEFMI